MANLSSNEALELARWWLKGQSVGSKPLFDGICSMCGTLLHDLSNGHRGDPVNRDGNPLLKPSGEPDVDAQPPFLLRFSPAFFAKGFHQSSSTTQLQTDYSCGMASTRRGSPAAIRVCAGITVRTVRRSGSGKM